MFWQFGPLIAAMVVLAGFSALFSCSEAALFCLQSDDRRRLKQGSTAQRKVIELLYRPERLLTAILFWNLLVNVVYFALSSVMCIQLERMGHRTEAGITAVVALVAIILCSEMVPKTIGVIQPRLVSTLVSIPLTVSIRALGPVTSGLTTISKIVRRTLFPNLRQEPYLELDDLEQAILLSTADEQLVMQEQRILQSIVSLSDLTAEELMRPRIQYQTFRPPVSLTDLRGKLPRSGYLLVTKPENDEIVSAIPLKHLTTIGHHHLEHHAQSVICVPWCCSVADTLEQLSQAQREVAAVVNELGETIGIVTLEDVLATVFEGESSRSARLLAKASIEPVGRHQWHVTGITNLWRVGRYFDIELPASNSTTIAGILQEQLQRLPVRGDSIRWSQFEMRVIDIVKQGPHEQGQITVELTRPNQRNSNQKDPHEKNVS